MYVLYGRPGSGNFVVEAALRLAGVEHRLETVPRGEPPADYLNAKTPPGSPSQAQAPPPSPQGGRELALQ